MSRCSVKYRLYPTPAQETALRQMLSTCCTVYNSLLNWRKHDYELLGESRTYYEQKKALPIWKQSHPELSEVHSQVLQDVCKRVDLAFAAFFRRIQAGEAPGYPRFKGEGHYDSLTYPQEGGFQVETEAITLSKVGTVKAVVHRALPGKAKTCTIRIQAGKWYACLSCQVETQPLPPSEEQVGIDVGLCHFAVTDDAQFVENPRFFRQDEKALAKAQRKADNLKQSEAQSASRLSRRIATRASLAARTREQKARRKKAKRVVTRIHERIRNRRHDFAHQLARRLVNRYGLIAHEELNVSGMVQNHHLAKSISDAAWSMFVAALTYKAESAGRVVIAVPPAYTSQDCSGCGERVPKSLSERVHACPMCGLVLDRDVNAARNILRLALAIPRAAVGLHSVPA